MKVAHGSTMVPRADDMATSEVSPSPLGYYLVIKNVHTPSPCRERFWHYNRKMRNLANSQSSRPRSVTFSHPHPFPFLPLPDTPSSKSNSALFILSTTASAPSKSENQRYGRQTPLNSHAVERGNATPTTLALPDKQRAQHMP